MCIWVSQAKSISDEPTGLVQLLNQTLQLNTGLPHCTLVCVCDREMQNDEGVIIMHDCLSVTERLVCTAGPQTLCDVGDEPG